MKPMDISVSGLNAAGTKMEVTANNVANSLTDGFKKSRTVNQEEAQGGVSATVDKVETQGPVVTDPDSGQQRELSNVDLGQEMINMIEAERHFEANLAALETEEEMIGTLIDEIV
ncbi:MAG: hypothetical protein JRJ59_00750 [Deltaproteobacteria bacterium]|nr:hypothetical protein [Deltaproteobacteria bacterium]